MFYNAEYQLYIITQNTILNCSDVIVKLVLKMPLLAGFPSWTENSLKCLVSQMFMVCHSHGLHLSCRLSSKLPSEGVFGVSVCVTGLYCVAQMQAACKRMLSIITPLWFVARQLSAGHFHC